MIEFFLKKVFEIKNILQFRRHSLNNDVNKMYFLFWSQDDVIFSSKKSSSVPMSSQRHKPAAVLIFTEPRGGSLLPVSGQSCGQSGGYQGWIKGGTSFQFSKIRREWPRDPPFGSLKIRTAAGSLGSTRISEFFPLRIRKCDPIRGGELKGETAW